MPLCHRKEVQIQVSQSFPYCAILMRFFDKYVVAHAVIESESDHTMDVAEEMIMCIDQSATSPELEIHDEVNKDQTA